MKRIIASLLILLGLFSVSCWAIDTQAKVDQAVATTTSGGDFLPVDQAYQMTPRLSANSLEMDWQIADGYYLYGKGFKASWSEDEQTQKLAIQLPPGKLKHDEYFGDVEVFYHQLQSHLSLPTTTPFTIKISSQGCADAGLCYPPDHRWFRVDPQAGLVTPLDPQKPATSQTEQPKDSLQASAQSITSTDSGPARIAAAVPASLLIMAAMAFVGGLILNLMPCVFPVLALKAISLLESSDTSAAERRIHGLVYTAGVVASFMFFAGLLMFLRASGQELGWGYQLQSPWFVAALVYLFFAMGLSFSGVVEFGAGIAGVGQGLVEKGGLKGTFFTGVLAVVVASPCTAPFMGASLGFALTQPMYVALTVFIALGLGMAAPFLLLSIIPGLGRLLPRPGNWMITLKEVMAFPMYLTGIWLLWVLGRQAGINAVMLVLIGCLLISMALYFWKKKAHWHRGIAIVSGIAAATILGSALLRPSMAASENLSASAFPTAKDGAALAYSSERLTSLQNDGGAIFLDVTADWCITCKANERLVLDTDLVKSTMADQHIRYMVADWTSRDAEVSRLLARYNRSGVPLYVYFPGGGKAPVVLPQILNKDMIISTFTDAQTGNEDQGG